MRCRILAVIGASAAAAISACGGDKGTTPTAQATMPDSAEQVVFGVQHSMFAAGVKKASLSADSAFVYGRQTRFELRGSIRLLMLDSVGAPRATLTANEATYSTTNHSMVARGNVVVTTTDGKKLDTQHLIYDQIVDKVSSDSAFVILEPTRRVQGTSFRSDPNLQELDCKDCVITSLTPIPIDTGASGAKPLDASRMQAQVLPDLQMLRKRPAPRKD
jgi:LPS export ABC transporter protein LptC